MRPVGTGDAESGITDCCEPKKVSTPVSTRTYKSETTTTKPHVIFRLIARMDSHFACDNRFPADCALWRELKRRIIRRKDAVDRVETTLREERERGIPLTSDTAQRSTRGLG